MRTNNARGSSKLHFFGIMNSEAEVMAKFTIETKYFLEFVNCETKRGNEILEQIKVLQDIMDNHDDLVKACLGKIAKSTSEALFIIYTLGAVYGIKKDRAEALQRLSIN